MFLASYVVGAALIYGTLALSPPLAVAIGPVNPLFAAVTQENTPPELLGARVRSAHRDAKAAIPIGAVIADAAVQGAGLIPTIVGMGVVYVVVTIGMFFNPALRGMGIRHEPVEVPAAAQNGETMVASRRTNIIDGRGSAHAPAHRG